MTNLNDYEFKASDSASVDAYARWRISAPETIFDSKQTQDNQPLFFDDQEVSGSGTGSTHSVAKARTQLSVSATTAGKRVRQTFMRFNYQPGKSQLVLMTGVLGAPASGITQNIGYMDDDNGLFFQCKDATASVVRRTSVTGSAVDNTIAQSSWNKDTMDGNGPSGVTIDFTKTQIFAIDFEWLGVGRIRFGFVHNGMFITCHEMLNSNVLAEVYMSTPNLPLRYLLENDGTGAAATLDHICSTVLSEGGTQDVGQLRFASTAGTEVSTTTENTIYAVVGIRLKAAGLSETVRIQRIALQIQTASEIGEWTLRFNPTVAGTFTYSDQTNSAVQTATGATANTVTGGTILSGGFAESGSATFGHGGTDSVILNALRLGAAIDGTPDEIVLCWMPTGGTSTGEVEGSISWRELN